MNTFVIVVLAVLAAIGCSLTLFFGSELQKKFAFMGQLINGTSAKVVYSFPGAKKAGISKGMRNIVLRSDGKPFRALIAFEFEFPVIGSVGSVDPYEFVRSGEGGVATISTYLGNGSVKFVFLVLKDDGSTTGVIVSSTEADQDLRPDAEYPPHWFQTLGAWG